VSLRYVKDHKIITALAGVVVVVAAVVVVVAGGFDHGSSAGVSSATCQTAMSNLSGTSADIQDENFQQLYTASNSAYNNVYDSVGYGSQLVKDLTSLESAANVLSSGTSDDTADATAALQAVYSDCGQSVPSS
jgi:hypothetical protein